MHLLREPFHLTPSVTEDDGLGDGQCLVQVAQRIQLPLLVTATYIISDAPKTKLNQSQNRH